MRTETIYAKGICGDCEKEIVKAAKKVKGVRKVQYDSGLLAATITFDERRTSIGIIKAEIERAGFTCKKPGYAWLVLALGAVVAGYFLLRMTGPFQLPSISEGMGLGLVFAVGLLTGFHCIGMCGGFVLSYSGNAKSRLSHIYYGAGKMVSYTIMGAAFGLLGSFIVLTPSIRGYAGIIAGFFLVVYSLRMLGVGFVSRFGIRTPDFVNRAVRGRGPAVIGLLNGLMLACGPLQAMYVMAAGTGSAAAGAKYLFIFGLGTLPPMLGFGYLATAVSRRFTGRLMRITGALVLVLGVMMVNNGLALTGSSLSPVGSTEEAESVSDYQVIRMDVTSAGYVPNKFSLKRGVPVKWIIQGKEINGCNNAIIVPELGLEFDIVQGEQVIEFTPAKEGVVRWSCWMGMIPGAFVVQNSGSEVDTTGLDESLARTGSCGCGA